MQISFYVELHLNKPTEEVDHCNVLQLQQCQHHHKQIKDIQSMNDIENKLEE